MGSDESIDIENRAGERHHRERDQQREPIVGAAPEDHQGSEDDHRKPDNVERELVGGVQVPRQPQLFQSAWFGGHRGKRHRRLFAGPNMREGLPGRSGDRHSGDADGDFSCHGVERFVAIVGDDHGDGSGLFGVPNLLVEPTAAAIHQGDGAAGIDEIRQIALAPRADIGRRGTDRTDCVEWAAKECFQGLLVPCAGSWPVNMDGRPPSRQGVLVIQAVLINGRQCWQE